MSEGGQLDDIVDSIGLVVELHCILEEEEYIFLDIRIFHKFELSEEFNNKQFALQINKIFV